MKWFLTTREIREGGTVLTSAASEILAAKV
jgi:hypothetical protein